MEKKEKGGSDNNQSNWEYHPNLYEKLIIQTFTCFSSLILGNKQ